MAYEMNTDPGLGEMDDQVDLVSNLKIENMTKVIPTYSDGFPIISKNTNCVLCNMIPRYATKCD